MIASPEIFVLDVGHGNCTVLSDTGGVTVIDCAPGVILTETLKQLRIKEISTVLISHADEDHVGGLIALLQEPGITVRDVYINPDQLRGTDTWEDVIWALRDARRTKNTKVYTSLTSELSGSLDNGEVSIEVIGPSPELVLGRKDLERRKLTPNSRSAVIRLTHKGRHYMLTTGDVDGRGLQDILDEGKDIHAEILVFPHHGGKAGGMDPKQFATEICSLVQPRSVIFSVSRGKKGFPRLETIQGVAEIAPEAHIACTQLSQECSTDTPTKFEHLSSYPAKGRAKNSCCAGTIKIVLGNEQVYQDFNDAHGTFVASLAPTMCQRLGAEK